jgi:hypothetical protein
VKAFRFHDEACAVFIHEVQVPTPLHRDLGERFDKAIKAAIYRAIEFPSGARRHPMAPAEHFRENSPSRSYS